MKSALSLITATTWLLRIEGAGHELGFKGAAKEHDLAVLVLAEFQKFFSRDR